MAELNNWSQEGRIETRHFSRKTKSKSFKSFAELTCTCLLHVLCYVLCVMCYVMCYVLCVMLCYVLQLRIGR